MWNDYHAISGDQAVLSVPSVPSAFQAAGEALCILVTHSVMVQGQSSNDNLMWLALTSSVQKLLLYGVT